jgi:hypothetical protein
MHSGSAPVVGRPSKPRVAANERGAVQSGRIKVSVDGEGERQWAAAVKSIGSSR